MTLIALSVFWKGIAVGFFFGFFTACAAIGAFGLRLMDRQEEQDSRQAP
jgi:hypothetical protein